MNLRNKSFSTIIITTNSIIFLALLVATYLLTYNVFSKNVRQSSDNLIQETSNQISYNYESYISNILQVSDIIQNNIQNDDSESYQNTVSLFQTLLTMKPEILNIAIYNLDGHEIIKAPNTLPTEDVSREEWFKDAVFDQTIHYFSPINPNNDEKYLVHFSKAIPITKKNNKGILKMDIDFTEIIELSYKTELGQNGHTLIIDDDYNLIHSSTTLNVDEEIELLKNTVLGLTTYHHDSDLFTVSLSTISNSRWRLAVFYNINDVTSTLSNFIFVLLSIEIGIFIVGTCIILLVTKEVTNPLKQLEKVMSSTDFKGDIVEIDPNTGTKEIYSLSKSYNEMTQEIKNLMKKVVEEQKNQRKSELKALQNQINPHFLYNTLDSIVWMIQEDQKEDAQNMIIALAKLFRISISRGNNIIPVKNEIEHVKNYLYIQSMRYKDAFTYKINVDEECYKYKVMKLILQPIVENSIYHGLKNRVDDGLIEIDGHMEDTNLILTITDNGYGISPEKIQDLYEKFNNPDLNDGVGLKNVYQRLRLYYGENSYLKIDSVEDEYTRIIISIPVEVMDDEIKA